MSLPAEILENFLFVGDSYHGSQLQVLQKCGITHIVNASNTDYSSTLFEQYSKEQNGNNPFNFFLVKVQDHPQENLSQVFHHLSSKSQVFRTRIWFHR
jgi:hypothetical protein